MKIYIKNIQLLFCLIILMPFIDMILGHALNTGKTGPITLLGQVYRILLMMFLIYNLIKKGSLSKGKWLLLFSLYIFTLVIVYNLRFNSSIVGENLSCAVKLLLPIYLVYVLYYMSHGDKRLVYDIFEYYSYIYPLSMLIPRILGIGYYNYANWSGYRGLYFANNDVNMILMILFIYSFQMLYNKFNKKNIIRIAINVCALLLIGSKTSIIAIIVVFGCFFFKNENVRKKLKNVLGLIIMLLILFVLVLYFLGAQLERTWRRVWQAYIYHSRSKNGIVTFLFSERNLRIVPSFQRWIIKEKNRTVNLLFGVGKEMKCPNDNIGPGPYTIIEMDGFDLLFWFGLITAAIIIIFYISVFIKSISKKGLFMEKVMFLLAFFFSMTAGHVLMSASSGTVFGIVTASMYISCYSKKYKDSKA